MIPAALAAAATYAALVRDDAAAGTQGWAVPPVPAAGSSLVPPVAHVHADAPVSIAAPPSAEPSRPKPPALPPPYVVPAPPPSGDPATPSVYDLLAGAPLVEAPAAAADETAGEVDGGPVEPEAEIADDPWQLRAPDPLGPSGDDASAVADAGATESADESANDVWQVPLDEGRFALGGWAASAGHSVVSAVTFRRRLPEDIGADRIVLEIDASENVPDGGLVVLADPGFAPDRDGFTLLLAAASPGPFSAAGSYRVIAAG